MIKKVNEKEIRKFSEKYYYHPAFEFPADYEYAQMFTNNLLGDHDLPPNNWSFYSYVEDGVDENGMCVGACFMQTLDKYEDPVTGDTIQIRRTYKISGDIFDRARAALRKMIHEFENVEYQDPSFEKVDPYYKEMYEQFDKYLWHMKHETECNWL